MKIVTAYQTIERAVIEAWPGHAATLVKSRPIGGDQCETQEEVSKLILKLVGDDIGRYVDGYRWMCQMILEEELEFRRKGLYRLSSFEEVERTVYANQDVMGRYMDGLLLSQVLWANHIALLDYYIRDFLGELSSAISHLEVGPGHGLLLYLASLVTKGRITGWDVSQTSLQHTQMTLERLGARHGILLEERSLFSGHPVTEYFDCVVISEVLEHLEHPDAALSELFQRMSPGSRIFINAPVNSPTLDHIYLFRTPEEIVDLVLAAGFKVESVRFAPTAGFTEERARKFGTSISCGIIGHRL
jgi:SAM-dependent methyltransferase